MSWFSVTSTTSKTSSTPTFQQNNENSICTTSTALLRFNWHLPLIIHCCCDFNCFFITNKKNYSLQRKSTTHTKTSPLNQITITIAPLLITHTKPIRDYISSVCARKKGMMISYRRRSGFEPETHWLTDWMFVWCCCWCLWIPAVQQGLLVSMVTFPYLVSAEMCILFWVFAVVWGRQGRLLRNRWGPC